MNDDLDIIISVGSNYMQTQNVAFARKQLASILGDNCIFTDNMWTDPIGIDTDKFLNFMCRTKTRYSVKRLQDAFKRMEKQCGRSKKNNSLGRIPLDIDILLAGTVRLHEDDWSRNYIQFLLEKVNYPYDI